jgi:hypothetical protein
LTTLEPSDQEITTLIGLPKNEQLLFEHIKSDFERIENSATQHQEWLINTFQAPNFILPVCTFTGIQNLSHMAADMLRGLMINWENTTSSAPQWGHEQWQQERLAQVMTLCRQIYIELLSLIEFSITHAIRNLPEFFPPPRGKSKIYLSQTFSASADLGWIPSEHKEAWAGLTEFRNALVHRNGLSDKTVLYKISENCTMDFKKDTRISGPATFVSELCAWAEKGMFAWSVSYLKHAAHKPKNSFFVP